MTQGFKVLSEAWETRDGPAILTTVSTDRKPNSVYVGEIQLDREIGFVVADNYFDKTRRNIKSGSHGSVLFITNEGKAFQVKGMIDYHTDGPVFDGMQEWHNPKHPGVAATVVRIEEVYTGAERLV